MKKHISFLRVKHPRLFTLVGLPIILTLLLGDVLVAVFLAIALELFRQTIWQG